MTPSEFLTQIWGDPPPGMVNIFTLPNGTSLWYSSFGTVDRDMQRHLHEEVYTGTSLATKQGNRFNSKNRIKVAQAAAIAGLWSDVDVYHPVAHAEKALPATLEQAGEVMEQLPHGPTMIVDSGHGLQYWWLFKEPWVFSDAGEHEQARRVTQWWHLRTKELFEDRGWTIDSVFDLARIMRLPGTFNNKVPGERKQVEAILQGGPRYDLEDFLGLVPEDFAASTPPPEDQGNRGGRTGEQGGMTASGLVLSPDAQPNLTRLEALLKADPKFRRTWEKNRPDMKDQSPSSYNMSIADIAIRAGWSDQEAVNAMIYWRRKHGHDLKLRENYYALTVAKAKGPIRMEQDQDKLDETLLEPPEDQEEVLKDTLASLFRVDIIRVVKYLGDPPVYYMETEQGNITLGTIERIYSQTKFREAVGAATDVVIPSVSKGAWERRVQAILLLREEVDVGDASHPVQQARAWVTDYLLERGIREEDEWERAAQARYPFRESNQVHIFLEDLLRWLEVNRSIAMSPHEGGRRMRQIGAKPRRINITVGKTRTTRSCWELPEDPDAPTGDGQES